MYSKIEQVIKEYFPEKQVIDIIDRGMIIKHTYKIIFEDNEILYLKLALNEEWIQKSYKEINRLLYLVEGKK